MIIWVMIGIVVCILVLLQVKGQRFENQHFTDEENQS